MVQRSKSSIFVLEYEGVLIHREAYSFVVSLSNATQTHVEALGSTQSPRKIGTRPSYHQNLLTALYEVSNRLLDRKLREREKELKYDINSLKEVVQNHYKKMEEFYSENLE